MSFIVKNDSERRLETEDHELILIRWDLCDGIFGFDDGDKG